MFYERDSGAPRFKVAATPEGTIQIEQAASLLAMHCLVRGQEPDDYVIMVPLEQDLLAEVTLRAQKLLEVGLATASSVRLSRREHEVLAGIVQNLRNKEIAARLCISERTVKFYVSTLLSKFRVRNRMALTEAANLILPREPSPVVAAAEPQALERKARSRDARRRRPDERTKPHDVFLPLAKSLVPA